MFLRSIESENFRNLKNGFTCHDDLNIIYGKNGQGKTNWLEAIYFLATTKSFRTVNLKELVTFGESRMTVLGDVYLSKQIHHRICITFENNRKTFLVNEKKTKIQDYVENLSAVIFNADQLEIVRGSPEARRKFLDFGITCIYPAFIQTLSDYQHCLKQKNALLETAQRKEFSLEKVLQMIEPWNEQIISLSTRIHKARVRYVEKLNAVLQQGLFNDEKIQVQYLSSLDNSDDSSNYAERMREKLAARLSAELSVGHSLVGVHRDDLEIKLNEQDLRKFGSSGQQRSALLNMLLATLEIYHIQNGEYPIFLIDDIDSELDYERIRQLLVFLNGKIQTFVTTSKESFLERFGNIGEIIHVEDGKPMIYQL